MQVWPGKRQYANEAGCTNLMKWKVKAVIRRSNFVCGLTRYGKCNSAGSCVKRWEIRPGEDGVAGGGKGWGGLTPSPQEPQEVLEGLPLRRWLNHGPLCCLGGHGDSDLDDMRRRWIRRKREVISPGQWILLSLSLEQVPAVGAFETWWLLTQRSEICLPHATRKLWRFS